MIEFVKRLNCPACGASGATPIWSGRFSDPFVKGMMEKFFYAVDLDGALGNQRFALVSCNDCGFRFHSHVIADEWVPIIYGEWISREQIASFEAAHVHQPLSAFEAKLEGIRFLMRLRKLTLNAGSGAAELRLLDFGCGDGKQIALARYLGIAAYGVDVSASRLMASDNRGCLVYPTLHDLLGMVDGPFHMVVLNQVLEHVKDPDHVLRSLGGCMATGGTLFVCVPNCTGIDNPSSFEDFHCVQPIEHINCFTPDSLRRFIERRGFAQLRRPYSVVTTSIKATIKSLVGALLQRLSTDQFFVRTP
jgi:SAM-dependent methyltransferase